MQHSSAWNRWLALALALFPAVALGDPLGVPRMLHPWGRCRPGAWKLVRITTETLDDRGSVCNRNVTETRTTLAELAESGVTLEVRTVFELAGKRFDSQPLIIRQGYHGEAITAEPKLQSLGAGTVSVGQQAIPCRIEQMEMVSANSRTVTTLYYCDHIAPYVFKRESLTTDLAGKNRLSELSLEVLNLSAPCQVLSESRPTTQIRTVQRNPAGTISTTAYYLPDVPGGVVYHQSQETDNSGRVLRKSELKLVAYGQDPEPEHLGLFGRRRASRIHKTLPKPPPPSVEQLVDPRQ